MDKQEVEILIYEQATRSQREAVARCQRRSIQAASELRFQQKALADIEETLDRLRENAGVTGAEPKAERPR